MGFRSLVSLALLVLPIAIAIGALFTVDAYRVSAGQLPLFVNNRVTTETYCQKEYGISPVSDGQQYTLNPNQWGVVAGESGALCMNVTTFNNASYPTKTTAPEFSITWQFPPGPNTAPVHAFPNIQLETDGSLPVTLSSLANINVDIVWNYGVGDATPTSTDETALASAALNADVAMDMYLDPSSSTSQDTTKAKYEVMIWLARIGVATDPIGWNAGPVTSMSAGGTAFSLYTGMNSLNQFVLTWVADAPATKFTANVSPFVTQLATYGGPSASDYLGYVSFGSETLSSNTNVTLSVPKLSMSVLST